MTTIVQKWGNSLALRIPSSLAKDVHLHQGSMVEVAVVEGKMVVEPKGQSRLSLAQMLKRITKTNRHAEHDWGKAFGQEIW
ncbi:MAG: AbrB/MazE/SpoVT family DNA-binding domain-containing protein [Elusimicrobia bacterium]|nr:AbrB/MazE/SpoVT family DNA-binding domain-containing protein [Elusimicrobiota bacterium]